jgi:hypothetical protein
MARDTEGAFNAPQAHPLVVGSQNLSFELVTVTGVRGFPAAFATATTAQPLFAIGSITIPNQLLAATLNTPQSYHTLRLQHLDLDHYL